jgi:hypothetical protein
LDLILSPLGHHYLYYKYLLHCHEKEHTQTDEDGRKHASRGRNTETLLIQRIQKAETLKAVYSLRSYRRPTQSGSPIQGYNLICKQVSLTIIRFSFLIGI